MPTMLPADLAELGTVCRPRVAALAGLGPHAHKGRTYSGSRHINGAEAGFAGAAKAPPTPRPDISRTLSPSVKGCARMQRRRRSSSRRAEPASVHADRHGEGWTPLFPLPQPGCRGKGAHGFSQADSGCASNDRRVLTKWRVGAASTEPRSAPLPAGQPSQALSMLRRLQSLVKAYNDRNR